MRHDTQQHQEDGHGHHDDIVTNAATQKKHVIIYLCNIGIYICTMTNANQTALVLPHDEHDGS